MKQKYFFILPLFLLCGLVVHAIETKLPPSFKYDSAVLSTPAAYHLDFKEDIQKLMEEDKEDAKHAMPLRIAVGTDVSLNLDSRNTTATVLSSSEQVWQYAIQSNGAKGLIITFDELYIPEGDELYVYTKDKRQVQSFTSASNPSGGMYATTALSGEEIIFEYAPAASSQEPARIKISNIAYIYKSLEETADDLSCYINTNCSEAENWQLQKNGVVRLMIPSYGGWGLCSASLINNVREDETPYILTANHCVSGTNGQVFSTLQVDFFRESNSSNCYVQTESSPTTKSLVGVTLVATTPINGSSDGTLLKLNVPIPEDWEVYYNGWDARDIPATSGVSIHHPNGFVKKIATFTSPLATDGNINMGGWPSAITGTNADWKVIWAPTQNGFSVTYGGSSGSPIFNQNGLIVGTLTGGGSYCETPTSPDYYGKFAYHWDKHSNPQQHFKNYLDPDNTGTLILEGYDPHGLILEGEPEAIEATDITPVGFTAHWNELANANKYYLDIYRKKPGGIREYVEGFERKDVGNVLSYAITDLDHETEYWYVVRGGYRTQITNSSNEVKATTDPPTFEYFYPVATNATEVTYNSFNANWDLLPEATSYLLNVYQKIDATNFTETANFTDRKLLAGWTKNSISYYTQEDQFGESAPSIRLSNDEYIQSPEYIEAVKSLQFWYRGISAGPSNALVVYGHINNNWTEIKRIQPLKNAIGGDIITLLQDELPGCTAIKILHERTNGYVAIDDIKVGYGTFPYTRYVGNLKDWEVKSRTNYAITDLESESQYYYHIIGYNGEKYSHKSNEIAVKTNIQVSINTPLTENKAFFRVDKENIYIHTDDLNKIDVAVYNVVGQLLISQSLFQQDSYISRKGLPSGIYFLKIGTETHKVLLK